ncbi:MAG: STN domain-containing protein [Cytophagaceae bacterium]|jgi:hypothetical protein|nr:STN domain-containing protein [Cytophagaceae bacterium]
MKLKIYTVAIFVIICLVANAADGDKNSAITLHLRHEPLSKAFDALSQQTGYSFSYSPETVDATIAVSISANGESIENVLEQLLPADVNYKFRRKHIILIRKPITVTEIYTNNAPVVIATENLQTENKVIAQFIEKISSPHSGNELIMRHSSENLNKITEMKIESNYSEAQVAEMEGRTSNNNAASETIAAAAETVKHAASEIGEGVNKVVKKTRTIFSSIWAGATALAISTGALAQNAVDTVQSKQPFVTSSGKTQPFQLSFMYPIGTGGVESAKNTYNVSVNVLGGITGSIEGVEMGSLFNINTFGSKGVQMAGLFNVSGVPGAEVMESSNVQMAGIFNTTRKGTAMLQMSGIFNLADSGMLQMSGIANVANSSNLQMAGIANAAASSNIQLAGTVNASVDADTQVSGVINVAGNADVQIAGVVNVAKSAGFQLGVLNIADSADFQLGLVNISRNGMMEVELGYDSFLGVNASFRSGKTWLYSIITMGKSLQHDFYSNGCGLGTSFTIKNRVGLGVEVVSQNVNLFSRRETWTVAWLLQAKPYASFKMGKFSVFASPVFNLSAFREGEDRSILPSNLHRPRENGSNEWIGFNAGVRYRIF